MTAGSIIASVLVGILGNWLTPPAWAKRTRVLLSVIGVLVCLMIGAAVVMSLGEPKPPSAFAPSPSMSPSLPEPPTPSVEPAAEGKCYEGNHDGVSVTNEPIMGEITCTGWPLDTMIRVFTDDLEIASFRVGSTHVGKVYRVPFNLEIYRPKTRSESRLKIDYKWCVEKKCSLDHDYTLWSPK